MGPNSVITRAKPTSRGPKRGSSTVQSTERQPPGSAAAILREIHARLREGDVPAARRLAAEGVESFPQDADLCNVRRVLAEGGAFTKAGTGRDTRLEFEWLRDPPAKYRGKWVALVGSQVVGFADTLKELLSSLPSDPDPTPLAVQVGLCRRTRLRRSRRGSRITASGETASGTG